LKKREESYRQEGRRIVLKKKHKTSKKKEACRRGSEIKEREKKVGRKKKGEDSAVTKAVAGGRGWKTHSRAKGKVAIQQTWLANKHRGSGEKGPSEKKTLP